VQMELAQNKIKVAIKHLLKKEGRTYNDLAKLWDCSVPTVKRQLGKEELSLTKLLTLLDWLGLTLSDLHKLAERDDLAIPSYTTRQNEFLAQHPREFSFLMKLYEELTPAQIAQKYKLSSQLVEQIVIQLEKYDLIRVGTGGKIKPAYPKMPSLEGALGEAHTNRLIDQLAAFQKGRIADVMASQIRGVQAGSGGGLSYELCEISERTYAEFLPRFRKVFEDFVEASKLDKARLKKVQLKTAVIGVSLFLCENSDRNLHLISDIFGEGLHKA
jgi:hypothetical protein